MKADRLYCGSEGNLTALRKVSGRFVIMKAVWLSFIFLFNVYLPKCEAQGVYSTNTFYEDVKGLFGCLYQNCTTRDNTLFSNGCDCGIECTILDTCCPDSVYRNIQTSQVKPSCRSINNNDYGFLMIDHCPMENDSNTALKYLCEEDYYKEGDPMRQVPVTSLLSNVTYKNYFCFRCNEANEDYVSWHLLIESYTDPDTEVRDESITLSYSSVNETWMASFEEDGALFGVNISIVPNYVRDQTLCFLNVTSTCSENWKDDEVRSLCNGYTFITEIKKGNTIHAYKNPHCAFCSFEDLNLTDCTRYTTSSGAGGVPFSFTHLLDINGSDGNKVGKKDLCNETSVWDPIFKKCRTMLCIEPGYIVSDGKCVPP